MRSRPGLDNYFKINNLWIKASLVFLFFFILFLAGHLSSVSFISSDDPYYHAKHAFLIEQSGNLTLVKPWLEFSFLNYAPTDLWWGFHLGMALFIHWFGLILGVKIFISFLAALVFLVFYLILSNLKITYPAVWIFLLFSASSILEYRLFLERPHLLTMIFLPVALWLLIKGKYLWLFFASLFYALSYHLAPLIIWPALIFIAVDAGFNKRLNLKPLIATAGGVLAGIIIHPASLNYLYVMFITIFKIFFLKFSGVDLHIGGELQLLGFFDFLESNFLSLLFYVLAVVMFLFLRQRGQRPVVSSFLFLYSSWWLLVTLIVPRGVEYWLPAVFLFIAWVVNDFIKTEEFRQIKHWLAGKVNFKVIGFFLISLIVLTMFYNFTNTGFEISRPRTGLLSEDYRQANDWLKAKTEPASIVFYDNWGMWPMMFFYNDHNHYITGMDPTLLYEYDERLYWLWRNLSADGLACDQPTVCLKPSIAEQIRLAPQAIKNIFRAKYAVVVNNPPGNLVKTFNSLRDQTELVFKNQTLLIYEIK